MPAGADAVVAVSETKLANTARISAAICAYVSSMHEMKKRDSEQLPAFQQVEGRFPN